MKDYFSEVELARGQFCFNCFCWQ